MTTLPTLDNRTDHCVLELNSISKTFPGTVALDRASLSLAKGEIHAVVGQNGSGKSTLVKVLAGYHSPDPGSTARLDQQEIDLQDPSWRRERLRVVHQDLGLVLELSATDNIALRAGFATRATGAIDWRRQRVHTEEMLERFGVELDVGAPLGEATPVQRTIVAIAAALADWDSDSGILVLDEPTAVLPPPQVDKLLATVDILRKRGLSVIYISHRLDEIFRMADSVTVLRGGRTVASCAVTDVTPRSLAELMVGRAIDTDYRARTDVRADAAVSLKARGLKGKFLDGVDLEVRAGEIVGIAGLPGSGSEELAYAIAGAVPGVQGEVSVGDEDWAPVRSSPHPAVPIVPADRATEALFEDFDVRENMSLSIIGRLRRGGFLSRRREQRSVQEWIEQTAVKTSSQDAQVATLSGGNQQKIVIARCLARDPKVLVMCEPTAGVDIGTRQVIYELIAARAREGLAVVVSSTDLGDLLAMCSRVITLVDGRISGQFTGDLITEESMLHSIEGTRQ
ncbi:sugar ABC transporter ATP-binding protein [Rhodococcoides yunnanense]|uniref:sugar ABC transporter ATP-binding protein n=1 Tax=Rhodococcoides yunnanense TaxID=278209 RepID=UPI0014740EB8|nr:sugar ABC transporter ATP-binding protein [Rhodococcus yunnanensis]